MLKNNLFMYNKKENVLYINTDALIKKGLLRKECLSYMRKPYVERIEDSPYKNQIKEELAKYPGCKISEFTNGPF